MTVLTRLFRKQRIWLWFAASLSVAPTFVHAQHLPTMKKGIQDITANDLAIAQLIDGVFLIIGLDGHVREFDLRPKNFFITSHFSADGTKLVGLWQQRVVVLNQNLVREWKQPIQMRNVRSLALSPDGAKVVFAAVDSQKQAVMLCIVTSAGSEEILESNLGCTSHSRRIAQAKTCKRYAKPAARAPSLTSYDVY
jgi:hypothetical protein